MLMNESGLSVIIKLQGLNSKLAEKRLYSLRYLYDSIRSSSRDCEKNTLVMDDNKKDFKNGEHLFE